MSASPLTPLDYIAEGYWQDFLAERPIAGGIAYGAELHHCQLDESLVSLQRVDTLLTQIRRDNFRRAKNDKDVKSSTHYETELLTDERYRNLLLFLAFYAGRVLAQHWQNTPHWYGQFELRKRYPEWLLTTDNFYQHMAVLYDYNEADHNENIQEQSSDHKNSDNKAINNKAIAPVFFALEPIGMRLFGNIDRQLEAAQGGQVAGGLYQAVNERLPHVSATQTSMIAPQDSRSYLAVKDSSQTDQSLMTNNTVKEPVIIEKASKPTSINMTKAEPIAIENPVPLAQAVVAPTPKISPTPEIFVQLLTDLNTIEVIQNAGNADYQRACQILDQFEQHIAKQQKLRVQTVFSDPHQAAKTQALTLLKNAAELGNSAAMLRLAMYELLGEGLSVDNTTGDAAGVDWVKQAANQNDSRAQRLLSRMYYQGIGLPQDINTGQYWLEQAAANGHPDAISLVAQWRQSQALITTQKQEQHSIKRYQLLLGVVAVIALLILIVV